MRILKLQYQLDRAEIEEALLCLDYKRRTVQRCKCRYYQPDRSRYASCICTKYAAIFLDCLIRCHGSSAFVYDLCSSTR